MSKKGKITIKNIASELNISLATVSRALNNHPYVNKDIRSKVIAFAKEHNYQPSSLAVGLRSGKTKTIGIIIPRNNRHYFSNVIFSIESVMAQAGYNTMICQSIESYEKEVNNVQMLINSNVSGIIISHSMETKNGDHLKEAIKWGIKVIQFDRVLKELPTSYVKNNNEEGARITVLGMLEQGYRKIALFHGNLSVNVFRERKKGYINAHKSFGIAPDKSLFFNDTLTREQGDKAAKKLIKNQLDFDAVFSCGDYAALGAYLHFKAKGYSIPQDVGIAGFANEPFTELTSPSITSVGQNSREMGRIIAEQLIKEIENTDYSAIQITVPTNQYTRESTTRKK